MSVSIVFLRTGRHNANNLESNFKKKKYLPQYTNSFFMTKLVCFIFYKQIEYFRSKYSSI
jgi:hypothetical protein